MDHIISQYLSTFLSDFVVKCPQTSSFFFIFQCRNPSLTKTVDSCSFLLKKYLIVVNLSNIALSLSHSITYVCYWRRNYQARNKLWPSMKTFLLILTESPNARNLFLYLLYVFLSFSSFLFFGLLRPLLQICRKVACFTIA